MNLLDDEVVEQRNKRNKIIMIVIIVTIILLLILSGVLLYRIMDVQKSTLKLNIDNKSTNFASDMFITEGDKLYINIKDFASLMGYEAFNGDYKTRYSEDTTRCYISSINEIASYSLNSSTMYKKVTNNEDYEYFDLDEPVKLVNEKLYVISEGMEIGLNCIIRFDTNNNRISVLSLNNITNQYISKFPNSAVAGEDDDIDFNNKKALRYDLVVVQNTDGHYGVYNGKGQEIIGTKYKSISFKEDSREFTVTTDEGKMGILSADGVTKIEPNYTEIKQISRELNYYLVNNNNKYGVINQNGNIVIYLEYDKIGIDEEKFNTNSIDNPYILFDNCIPVMRNDKWGIFDITGKQVLNVEYDEVGCLNGTQANQINNNVVIIPKYEGIVVGKEDKYGIVSSSGEQYVPIILDSVYSITTSGEDKYYMTFTIQVEQDGRKVDNQQTYDLDQYFEEHVIDKVEVPQVNQNTVETNTEVQEQNQAGINVVNNVQNGATNVVTANQM